MNDVPKVLVVDDGERTPDRALSVELAELGYASVTTSFEAAEDVLEVLPLPSAILLQLPNTPDVARHQDFRDLAERLKAKPGLAGIPVVMVEPTQGLPRHPAVLYQRFEPFARQAFAKPARA